MERGGHSRLDPVGSSLICLGMIHWRGEVLPDSVFLTLCSRLRVWVCDHCKEHQPQPFIEKAWSLKTKKDLSFKRTILLRI